MRDEPCNPFPFSWERNVDFVPLLSLQAKLNEQQKLFQFQGHVSKGRSKIQKPIRTDLGISIAPSTSMRSGFEVSYGSISPNTENGIPQKEIWDNIKEEVPDVIDVAIRTKGIVHDVPENVMFQQPLDGAEYLFQKQTSIGNRYRSIRHQTQIPVINPLNIAKEGLYGGEIIRPGDPCMRRIRGVLTTEYILPSNNNGYNVLSPILLDIERGLRGKIQGRATGRNWWEDTACPHTIGGQINNSVLNIRVCLLDDRQRYIGI